MKIWSRFQTAFQVMGSQLCYSQRPREVSRDEPKERRAMRYKDPYTGMGYFACLLIDKPPSSQSTFLFAVTDRSGRQWLCCDMGKPAMEAAAIVMIYDSIVCEFAQTMGEPVEGAVLTRSPEEQEKWSKWYGRIQFVQTPSIEALADVLSKQQN